MKIKYHKPPNYLEKITEMWAYVSVDSFGEGIIGAEMETPNGVTMMPFVCADKARMESLKPLAIKIAKDANIKVKLIHLSVREEIEDIG